jgi:hypothetical protein
MEETRFGNVHLGMSLPSQQKRMEQGWKKEWLNLFFMASYTLAPMQHVHGCDRISTGRGADPVLGVESIGPFSLPAMSQSFDLKSYYDKAGLTYVPPTREDYLHEDNYTTDEFMKANPHIPFPPNKFTLHA